MKLFIDHVECEAPEGFAQVDATYLPPGKILELGPLPPGVELVALVTQLLRSQRIITFVHAECELELASTSSGVHVTGTHTYFTNCRNDDPLDFTIECVDGTLRIRGN